MAETLVYTAIPCGMILWTGGVWIWRFSCLICHAEMATLAEPLASVQCPCGQVYQLGGCVLQGEE